MHSAFRVSKSFYKLNRCTKVNTKRRITVLGIETSCDDTAVAVVNSKKEILGEAITGQDEAHKVIKGIIPHVAAEKHQQNINKTIELAMSKASVTFDNIDAIAFTRGPGLGLCLDVGLKKAKELASEYRKIVIPVNHMEGHALVSRLEYDDIQFPFLTLLVSGGHTMLLVCKGVGDYVMLGTTNDDAAGEAFDKVARMLELEWQGGGGKAVERWADQSTDKVKIEEKSQQPPIQIKKKLRKLQEKTNDDNHLYVIPEPMVGIKNCNFSFSGIKCAAQRIIESNPLIMTDTMHKSNLTYSLQLAVCKHLITRTNTALKWCIKNEIKCKSLVVSGGVASNKFIRSRLQQLTEKNKIGFFAPSTRLCTDNGVMIAWAGIENYHAGKSILSHEEAQSLFHEPSWKLDPSGIDYFPSTHSNELKIKKYVSIFSCIQLSFDRFPVVVSFKTSVV
eukprot:TRINITY_DN4657_c0_g1_i3.p2 TRINITY_DN4657_c0_g1~~TRINITY_DN4657_c0_g1_i3.p2  ORF type:complete len:448 (+),score=63.37 TRINITY_DN4657_c0_g1_i3:1534-2877(+)